MPTTLTNGIQLPDKGSVDWYGSMQSNYNLIDTHLGDTDVHVTAEDKANWNSKQGSLSQAQLDAIAQVATNTDDIASLQSGKANASHTHSSNDITDIGDYATKQYVDNSISDLVDNAPAALDTLKELSTALNDDANFASTVATALSAKANSADLATVATSGSYTDLTDKPTIPTVNDATLTIQKNGVDVQTFTANASSNVTANITVPTKTSDLTNDSNFVDTSNSAVASGITSAKVTDYDSHIADTDIHVTTADKNKWNNQTYVFRYSSTALVASSTNSNTLLDNTDNLKIGDKVIDSSGVLFSITAIDTQNSTFTIGTALIDLAQDSDVVHKSGDETVIGNKRFGVVQSFTGYPTIRLYSTIDDITVLPSYSLQQDIRFTDKNNAIIAYFVFQHRNNANEPFRTCWRQCKLDGTSGYYSVNFNNLGVFYPENNNAIDLGGSGNKWKSVYATNYYYGSNNVEFSDKFVTTDTAQTISGTKTFSSGMGLSSWLYFTNTSVTKGTIPQSTISPYRIYFGSGVNYGNSLFNIDTSVSNTGVQTLTLRSAENVVNGDDTRLGITYDPALSQPRCIRFKGDCVPSTGDTYECGTSSNKWKSFNGLNPSSLSLPDLDNGVDISSYITHLDKVVNSYTPSVNGWISIRVKKTSLAHTSLMIYQTGGLLSSCEADEYNISGTNLPVIANQNVEIYIYADALVEAKFYPCQGNV